MCDVYTFLYVHKSSCAFKLYLYVCVYLLQDCKKFKLSFRDFVIFLNFLRHFDLKSFEMSIILLGCFGFIPKSIYSHHRIFMCYDRTI